jgi:poly(A) polymerase
MTHAAINTSNLMDAQSYAEDIVKKLVRAGYVAYFAGGWVRDFLLGHPSDDIDIATSAPPEKILDLFPRTILVGLAFGIVIVIVDGHQFEVATFRRDIDYEGGRRPKQVIYSSPQEDAYRRDFTINGMFYDPLEEAVHDYVQGKHDLKAGIIRAIGNPQERFFEDRLRMIRAIRFAARFGFSIDIETQEAIRENAPLLFPSVAIERIWQEFCKMSKYPHFDAGLIEMHRLGLLPVIFPTLEKMHLNEVKYRVSPFSLYPKNTPTILYLTALFEDSLEQALEACEYIRASTQDAKLVEFFFYAKELASKKEADPVIWAHFYAHPHAQLCMNILVARQPEERRHDYLMKDRLRQNALQLHIERLIAKKPLVNASFLQKRGIPNGKIMGALLKEAERIAINQNLSSPETVLALLQKTPIWPK